jgi:tRNA A58 N-methylase Trm61
MDLPSPWEAVQSYYDSLKSSARVVAVVPTYNQLEKIVEAFEQGGFVVLETVDIMSQGIKVKRGAVRPMPLARSHNAFLVVAAKSVAKG